MRKTKIRNNHIKTRILFTIIDIVYLTFSLFICIKIRFFNEYFQTSLYKQLLVIIITIDLLLTIIFDIYKGVIYRNKTDEIKKTIIHVSLSFLLIALYLFSNKKGEFYSRLVLYFTYLLYFFISLLGKNLIKKLIVSKASNSLLHGGRSLLIIGDKKTINSVVQKFVECNYDFYLIYGICVVDDNMEGQKIESFNVVSNINNLLHFISTNWIDEIFIATNQSLIPKEIIEGIALTGVPIHQIIDSNYYYENRIQYVDKINEIDVITLIDKEYPYWQIFCKKVFDIVGGIIGSLLTIILIIVIGPIIYFKSPGPIIYVSKRVGENGKIFNFYKFRSMILNADELKSDLISKNRNKDGMMFKIENDPRIIKGIGSFIRKTSLDEFPQFFNVLKGDMSLIGTRPPTLDEWDKYTPYYRSRLSIKPGITGMWQVSGRSEITDFNEVVKLDNEYIKNWSIWLDIKILLKTIIKVFSKDKGAM